MSNEINEEIRKPIKVSNLDIAFPAHVSHLLPAWNEIPVAFKEGHTEWNDLFSTLFYSGGSVADLVAKPGIDRTEALRHIKACMGSFEPKHEHKEAGCAFLFSLWFEPSSHSQQSNL